MNKIRTIWNNIPKTYRTIMVVAAFFGLQYGASRINNNISHAQFDESKKMVEYTIQDTDGFGSYSVQDEKSNTLDKVVLETPLNKNNIRYNAVGYIQLPPGEHILIAKYTDLKGNKEIDRIPVEVPEMQLR